MRKFLLLSFMLMFAFTFSESWAQERTVSGKVTSVDDGSTLPGVNVVLKGTTTGTVTDVDGNYKLSVPSDGGTLVFSFIGLATEEIEVGSRSVIDVQMSADVQQLTEVVVTGYGIERAPNEVTYQTKKVDSETLMQGQQQVAAAALTGKVAGLQINIENNGVNPQTQILLRGLRSISSNNEAMVVIDGAVSTIGAFNDLNSLDIESIDVLKGASAGALYGSRAANGAVIVQTKKGRRGGKFIVGLNSSLTFEEVSFMPQFQSKYGNGWDGAYDPIENTSWGPRFDGVVRQVGPTFPDDYPIDTQMVPYAPVKDNLKNFYETGNTFQNSVYFSGGDETTTFYSSIGRVNTKGIVPDDEYERTTYRFNATKELGKFKIGLNSTYFEDETDVVGSSIGDQDRTLYWFVLNTQPNIPLENYKDWDNPLSYAYADNYYNAYYQNPYWAIGTNRNTDKSNRLVANINGKYEIKDYLDLSARIGVNRHNGTGKSWRDAQTYDPVLQPAHSPVTSYVVESEFQSTEVNGNVILTGNFDLSSDFTLKPYIGASFIDYNYRSSYVQANNLSIPGFYDISNGTGELVGSVDQARKRTYGFFGNISLAYRGWAHLEVAGRQDYTSTLPIDDNSYFYPSVSGNVILSDAIPSITDNGILSFVKITALNATVYNDLPIYALNERYSQPRYFPFGSINGFSLSGTTVDPNIKKEKLNNFEVGLELGLLNDRIGLNATYYNTKTTNLITQTTPSNASGASVFLTNIGELSNTGFEFELDANVLKIGDFSWDVNVNFTHYETVIEEIKDDLKEIGLDVYSGGYGTYAIVGKAFPQIKALSYVRDSKGRIVVDANTGNPELGEVEALGKTTPDYILAGTTIFKFKGFSASATVDYRTGHIYYAQGSDAMEFTGRSLESVSADRQDFVWPNSVIETSEGVYTENTNIPISGGIMGFWQNTYNDIKENYVKDASAFKIREVAVNYTLPAAVLGKIGFINRLTVGFVGRNLWTRLPKGTNRFSDPEFRNTRGSDDPNGIGIGGYLQSPPTRSYGFSLNVEF